MASSSQTPEPLSPGRLADIRQTQPTAWTSNPWTIREVDGNGDCPDVWQVLHDGTVLATLPDWAGSLTQIASLRGESR